MFKLGFIKFYFLKQKQKQKPNLIAVTPIQDAASNMLSDDRPYKGQRCARRWEAGSGVALASVWAFRTVEASFLLQRVVDNRWPNFTHAAGLLFSSFPNLWNVRQNFAINKNKNQISSIQPSYNFSIFYYIIKLYILIIYII